jgi:uncharacterized YigZ family protein
VEIIATTYRTLDAPSQGIFKDKGSKFLSFAYPVKSEKEIKIFIDHIKKDYFDARHHCYAYQLGVDKKVYRINDDGEPSGTAGKPIYGQIQSNNLTNILIIVVRYFGGTLLGTSGLIQAYKQSSSDAIGKAKIIECSVYSKYNCQFNFQDLNSVMKIIKDYDIIIENQLFDLNCSVILKIKKQNLQNILNKIKNIDNVNVTYICDE